MERAPLAGLSPSAELARYEDAGVVTTVLAGAETEDTERAEAALFDAEMASFRPDVLFTYGGGPAVRSLLERARLRGIPVIFRLANLCYRDCSLFDGVARVLVPSAYAARFYRERLELTTHVLHSPVDPRRALAPQRRAETLTFVCPTLEKGLLLAAKVFERIGEERPDFPIDRRGPRGRFPLARAGARLEMLSNLRLMRATDDPRAFLGITRSLLVPSLDEPFPRVAMEAMLNGIPIVGARRGGLPELIPEEWLIDIDERHVPESLVVPSAQDAAPWVTAIMRVWDDPAAYEQASATARRVAASSTTEALTTDYVRLFEGAVAPAGRVPRARR